MNDYQTIQDLNQLDLAISDRLEEFLDWDILTITKSYLYIDPKSLEVEILHNIDNPKDDYYPLNQFFRSPEEGNLEIDYDETHDVASGYVFIR